MSIQSQLTELGVPKMEGKARFYYQIGAALMTFAVLGIFGWVSLVFGKMFGLSFAWIISVVVLAVYFLNKVDTKPLLGAAAALVAMIIFSNIADTVFSPMLGLFVFVASAAIGWLMQQQACKMQGVTCDHSQQMKAAVYAPLSFAVFMMSQYGLLKDEGSAAPQAPVQQPTEPPAAAPQQPSQEDENNNQL